MTLKRTFTSLALATLFLPACVIVGVEPDVIGEGGSDEETSSAEFGDGDADGDQGGDGDGDSEGNGDGDGDQGDAGDGDGDAGTGDGDGDPDTGDGDGDSDAGDGDSGDGDGDTGEPCENLEAASLISGANLVDVPNLMSSYTLGCGPSGGPDKLLVFEAPEAAMYEVSVISEDFAALIAQVGPLCDPLDELQCAAEGESFVVELALDERLYLIVDSDENFGTATVSVDKL